MKLHLRSIGDHAKNSITVEHVDPTSVPTIEDMKKKKKKEHNQAMLEIASALSYAEFDDIKGCTSTFKMWEALKNIYRGYQKVQREKKESLRGKFDDMRMEEGENIAQYASRIKEVVSAIRSATGVLDDETIIRKVLRTLLLIYAIRVSVIQELRCIPEIN